MVNENPQQTKALIILMISLVGIILVLVCLFLPYFSYTTKLPLVDESTTKETGISLIDGIFSPEETEDYAEIIEEYSDVLNELKIDAEKIALGFVFTAIGAFAALLLGFITAILLAVSILIRNKVVFTVARIVSILSFALSALCFSGVMLILGNLDFSFSITFLVAELEVSCTSALGASAIMYLVGSLITAVSLFFVDFSALDVFGKAQKVS